jgi:adenylate cyclase
VSIGAAPNIAAVLSDLREAPYRTFITKTVYDRLADESKLSSGVNMWEARKLTIKGKETSIYRSSYHWSIK